MANDYLFTNLFFFMSGEGDRALSPPFPTTNAVMSASSALLETFIASSLPTSGTAKEAIFPMGIKLLIAIRSLLPVPMASGQCCHLACQLALTPRCCKRAFLAQCIDAYF